MKYILNILCIVTLGVMISFSIKKPPIISGNQFKPDFEEKFFEKQNLVFTEPIYTSGIENISLVARYHPDDMADESIFINKQSKAINDIFSKMIMFTSTSFGRRARDGLTWG